MAEGARARGRMEGVERGRHADAVDSITADALSGFRLTSVKDLSESIPPEERRVSGSEV